MNKILMKHVQKQKCSFMTREQAKKRVWSFWKSCQKPCFLYVCFLSRLSFHPSIHPTNNPTIHPSIHRSLPSRKIAWRFWKFYLLPISVNSAHVSFPWIPHRCSVWPIVSLESRWQWNKLKWSLSIQKCQRLVISQRLRFLIIMWYYTWQQKCLLLKLLSSIVACQTGKFIVP